MKKYIDRDEFVKRLNENVELTNPEEQEWVKDECIRQAHAMPSVNVSEWISVEERLPEPNEECLVSAMVGDRVVIDLGELVQYCDGRIFGWMTTNDWNEGEGCKITHWMPLPSAPKKEKNND